MNDINTGLLIEVDRANLKRTKRRRRRAGSKVNDAPDLLPVSSDKMKDINKSTQVSLRKMSKFLLTLFLHF